MDIIKNLYIKAAQDRKIIVLPEGEEERVIVAASKATSQELAEVILLGNRDKINATAIKMGVKINDIIIIDPSTSENKNKYINRLFELRKEKGMTIDEATLLILNPVYFGIMMVKCDDADGLVSGAIHTTVELFRPALKIIKAAPNTKLVSSFFAMQVPNCDFGEVGFFLFADCGLNMDPNSEELAEIAISTARTSRKLFSIEPRVAMLSFSTKDSASSASVDKVKRALEIVKEKYPDMIIDGELQLDAAIIPEISKTKSPNSILGGRANILIFPNLDAGNIGYKLVERLAKAKAVGPLCQGFDKPINDLSRGCNESDIVDSIVITAVQAQVGN